MAAVRHERCRGVLVQVRRGADEVVTETTRNGLGLVVLLIVVVCSFACYWRIVKANIFEPKMLIGMFVVLALFILSLIIALAHVTQDSSYGLGEAIGGLIAIATQFATAVFGKSQTKEPNDTNLTK